MVSRMEGSPAREGTMVSIEQEMGHTGKEATRTSKCQRDQTTYEGHHQQRGDDTVQRTGQG